jgi:kynureninase
MTSPPSLQLARQRDASDPLRALRDRYAHPRDAAGRDLIYLCGHSLGLAPLQARMRVLEEIDDWERLAVEGHHAARRPWIDYADALRPGLATLVGAEPRDVVAMNSLTVNLHLLLASFYRPGGARRQVLIEAGAFSSDRHAVVSQLAWHGMDPATDLIELAPRPGADLLDEDDLEAAIAAAGERLALVLWPGVQFRTGQAFDCARIVRAAHAVGAIAGFDHAHAIGNVPLSLAADDADFAVWCSYKYLNAGPGAVGGAFLHPRHSGHPAAPRLAGWWGHDPATRFQMRAGFLAAPGAAGWAVSNPPILSSAPLLASLEDFATAGIAALRRKSVELTAYAEATIAQRSRGQVITITPADPAQRGCQLSLRCVAGADATQALFTRLTALGVVCDFRAPDIVRIAPAPLYNGYADVWEFGARLATALDAAP